MKYAEGFVVDGFSWIYHQISKVHIMHLPIFFIIASLSLRQSQDYPHTSEVTLKDIQWGAVKTQSIFSQILPIDTPYLAVMGEVWGVFLSTNYDLCNVWVTAVLYEIPCYIALHYNGTRLYIRLVHN